MKWQDEGFSFECYTSALYTVKDLGLTHNFLKNLPRYFNTHGTTIHKARNTIKIFEINGRKLNIKKFCIPPIINRILYSLNIRSPKCKRAFFNAERILQAGFNTPKPFAYIIQRKYGLIYYSYFISEQIPNVRQIGHDCKDKNLIKAFAVFTADLHERGLASRDYTPGNILYRKTQQGYNFTLVDVNRFDFFSKPLNIRQACKSLYAPFRNENRLKYFVRCYGEQRGFNISYLINKCILLRRLRNRYSTVKKNLKKLPAAKKLSVGRL